MNVYKLTKQDMTTYRGFRWELGVEAPKLSGKDGLCSSGFYHYYHHPLLAIFLNPIHANIVNPRMWEAWATGKHKDDSGLKGGSTRLKLTREIEVPSVTVNQRVVFGILCALEVCEDATFIEWANAWLDGSDRTIMSADIAVNTAYAASISYASAYDVSSVYAAYAAANAANASSAAYATHAAAFAAKSTVNAVRVGMGRRKLIELAEKALGYSESII